MEVKVESIIPRKGPVRGNNNRVNRLGGTFRLILRTPNHKLRDRYRRLGAERSGGIRQEVTNGRMDLMMNPVRMGVRRVQELIV
jgi:hypothetical protein